jgi:predicted CoA-substrate-specific enzyme activase
MRYFCGIDSGACATKAVIIDQEQKVVGFGVVRSGVDFKGAAETALKDALSKAGISKDSIAYTVACGYGRSNVPADERRTEIACHGKGCYFFFPKEITIVDIGAQDSKIIKLNSNGMRKSFKMNRKCAAGTGAFLEEIANRLNVPLDDLDRLARDSTNEVVLGSYCTVFTATEILEKIRAGIRLEDIIKGVFASVIKRIFEMDSLIGDIVLSGGVVACNPILAEMLKEQGVKVYLPPFPQLMGAFGAAIFALEAIRKRK